MFLLDTNVISELRKTGLRKAHPAVAAWDQTVDRRLMYLSAISIEESEIGILRVLDRDPHQARVLREWLDGFVIPDFTNRILPVDLAVAKASARLHVPVTRPVRDALIAATALVHDFTVVTRNVVDFAPMGVRVLNPWES